MRAVDSNVVARFLPAYDIAQYRIAREMMHGNVPISWKVFREVKWLLLSRLGRFEAGADFADMLHLAAAQDATAFLTFDREFARHASLDTPCRVEMLSAG